MPFDNWTFEQAAVKLIVVFPNLMGCIQVHLLCICHFKTGNFLLRSPSLDLGFALPMSFDYMEYLVGDMTLLYVHHTYSDGCENLLPFVRYGNVTLLCGHLHRCMTTVFYTTTIVFVGVLALCLDGWDDAMMMM